MSQKQLKDQPEKRQTHIWLSVVKAILLLFILVLLIWILTNKMGDINLSSNITVENWFSYLVTLIGVFVTVFVGLQIYNTVEAKRAMKDAEDKFDNLKNRTEVALNAFKDEFNGLKIGLLEKQYEVTKKVDWDLKEVKKEYWHEITSMKDAVKKTEQTQTDIETQMGSINKKWEDILKTQESFSKKMSDYKHDLANAFLQISKTYNNNDLFRVLTGLKSINLQEDFSGKNIDTLIRVLDNLIGILESNNTEETNIRDNIVQEAHDLRHLTIDSTEKKYCEVQEKIYKMSRLAEQLPIPKDNDDNYAR